MTTVPPLSQFISEAELRALVERSRAEDLGPLGRDVTSECTIDRERAREGTIVARAPGCLAGAALLPMIAAVYDPALALPISAQDGQTLHAGDPIAQVRGPLRSLLAFERIALNFLTHLSGVATLTARFVEKTAGTKAKICDTRKTIPGLRALQKYAVACGGGVNHRIGLYDTVLIKDNHITGVRLPKLAEVLTAAINRARAINPPPTFIEVEVDSIAQLRRALACQPDMVLLDNMQTSQLRKAVALRDTLAPAVLLEASGGITLANVRRIAETGVDRISIGALTHSAPALDIALDIKNF